MRKLLEKLSLIERSNVEMFYPRVRDCDSTRVMRCKKSGIIFLENSPVTEEYYHAKVRTNDGVTATPVLRGAKLSTPVNDDDSRRAKEFGAIVRGKSWLDFGTGRGGLLKLLRNTAAAASGFEINQTLVSEMRRDGFEVFDSLAALQGQSFDVITMFHVLEHLFDPIETLVQLRDSLKEQGRVVVEVPHANDFLLQTLDLDAFKEFTFWSEHLILHTRASLRAFLELAGFKDIVIKGYQRYNLDNHLYWLRKAKPGGHEYWSHLLTDNLRGAYSDMLCQIDQTDTLVAYASK